MREIKFRAFDSRNGIWFPDSLTFNKGGRVTVCFQHENLPEESDIKCNPFCGRDFHLMQYTGLKDKNGVEIYEGDIVRETDHNPAQVCAVAWTDDCYGHKVGFDLVDEQGNCHEYYYGGFDNDMVEVIGNIYENPDLIK